MRAMASVRKCLFPVQSVHLIATLPYPKLPLRVAALHETQFEVKEDELRKKVALMEVPRQDSTCSSLTGAPEGNVPNFHPDLASTAAIPKPRTFSCPRVGLDALAEGESMGEPQDSWLGLGEPDLGKEATTVCRDSSDADGEGGCPCTELCLLVC
ncbi:hypothetical protein AV530_016778 [Patagioenas fasciata monilis]|uniref:Uncharacterized protein n=1 Tax=Patagioenas fasciata monilis TaxID=372326 RepID=A0A1V4J441_PATFA|nr:hypothetical protein AV530_016778 [Patagioenas fasciata monilis]